MRFTDFSDNLTRKKGHDSDGTDRNTVAPQHKQEDISQPISQVDQIDETGSKDEV